MLKPFKDEPKIFRGFLDVRVYYHHYKGVLRVHEDIEGSKYLSLMNLVIKDF